jgi:hypothetical protein
MPEKKKEIRKQADASVYRSVSEGSAVLKSFRWVYRLKSSHQKYTFHG